MSVLRVVLHDGRVAQATAEENGDLFWVLRGGRRWVVWCHHCIPDQCVQDAFLSKIRSQQYEAASAIVDELLFPDGRFSDYDPIHEKKHIFHSAQSIPLITINSFMNTIIS